MFIIWGSRCLGRSKERRHLGACRNCGKVGKLVDYQTRKWFTLYFIPIIPLERKQVVDCCPSCKGGYEMSERDYREARRAGHGQMPMERQVAAAVARGELEEARGLLVDAGDAGQAGSPDAPLALIRAYQSQQAHEKALEVARLAMSQQRDLAWDMAFRKAVGQSEKACPQAGTVLPSIPLLNRRVVRWAIAAAAVLLVYYDLDSYMRARREVHLANGLPGTVTVVIDGADPVEVGPDGFEKISLSEGTHEGVFTDATGRTETVPFEIERNSFFSRFFDDTVHVVNPFGAAVVVWEEVGYAEKASDVKDDHRFKVHLGERLIRFEDVDYVFEEFPDEVKMPEYADVTHKTRVAMHKSDPVEAIFDSLARGEVDLSLVLDYAEAHLTARSDNRPLLSTYVNVGIGCGAMARCREFLSGKLTDRPILLEWHRYHQIIADVAGERGALRAKYRSLLASDPRNADLLYLTGRVAPTVTASLEYVDRALKVDPMHPRSLMARWYLYMGAGRFAEADAVAALACQAAPDHPEFVHLRRPAQFALRQFSQLNADYGQALRKDPFDIEARLGLLEVQAARGESKLARRGLDAYEGTFRKERGGDPDQAMLRLRLDLMTFEGDYAELMRRAGGLEDDVAENSYKFYGWLSIGRAEVAAALPTATETADAALSVAIGLHTEGKTAAAAQWRAKACKLFAESDGDGRAYAALLARGAQVDPDVVVDTPANYQQQARRLVALVQAGADPKLLDLAEKLNFSLEFPHHLVKRAIRHARKNQPRHVPG